MGETESQRSDIQKEGLPTDGEGETVSFGRETSSAISFDLHTAGLRLSRGPKGALGQSVYIPKCMQCSQPHLHRLLPLLQSLPQLDQIRLLSHSVGMSVNLGQTFSFPMLASVG